MITDNLSSMKWFVFQKYIVEDDILVSIQSIHPIVWFLGWIFYLGSLLFCIYWVFSWGIRNGI